MSMNFPSADSFFFLGPESAGILMTPEEFDGVEDYDDEYRYELVHGVLVVTPFPSPPEAGANDLLGYLLLAHREKYGLESGFDTLPHVCIRTNTSRRLVNRSIWTGLGRIADPRRDVPTIAVEFVSAGRRNRQRDYMDKRQEYMEAGVREYWIIDRFQRTLTLVHNESQGPEE